MVAPVSPSSVIVSLPASMDETGAFSSTSFLEVSEKVSAFFRSLNAKSCKNFTTMQDCEYQDHFMKSKAAILTAAKDLKGTALILGVGGAYGLPLEQLAEQFDQVDLVDFDLSLIPSVLSKIPEHLRSKFHLHEADLTGVWKHLDEVLDKLTEELSFEDFCDAVPKIVAELKAVKFPYAEHSASFVVSSLLASQLSYSINQYINDVVEKKYGRTLTVLNRDMLEVMMPAFSNIETSHLSDLLSWVGPEGKVYFADSLNYEVEKKYVIPRPLQVTNESTGTITLFSSGALRKYIASHFNVCRQQEWNWVLSSTREVSVNRTMRIHSEVTASARATLTERKIFAITSFELTPK